MDTDAVHCGERRWRGSVTTPIAFTSTFVFKDMEEVRAYGQGETPHYEYGRYGNPTREAGERKLAALEDAERCLLFDTGMSAITSSIMALCKTGDHIVITDDAYKQTLVFVTKVLPPKFGVTSTVVPMGDYQAMADAIRPETVLIVSETPTNPYLNIADIDEVVRIARDRRVLSMIDSTFATAYNQKPLTQGVDFVITSATKYIGGHNDLLGGAVLGKSDLLEPIHQWHRTTGGVIDSMSCYLLLRGLKTFTLRMARLNSTAQMVAEFLESHAKVRKVYYPGLPSHRHHELAKRMMKGFGAVVTFEINGDLRDTMAFFNELRLCMLAPSFGGPETLITHPAGMSYYKETREERYRLGIVDELVRLSVGLEDPQDIIEDLDRGLSKVR
ncbi:MAG: aminotransferase class I/II-fold pyridoxal phosphate-dependent enzyme [Phycisphaerae bacterium]|nr:aminotransferase class I/II-fold pyridoxal phosphate-dependent enzyme [Phycisphaerae bacterium]